MFLPLSIASSERLLLAAVAYVAKAILSVGARRRFLVYLAIGELETLCLYSHRAAHIVCAFFVVVFVRCVVRRVCVCFFPKQLEQIGVLTGY